MGIVTFYFAILLTILISVPAMSAMVTAYNGMTRKVNPANLFDDWILSTLRRLVKVFAFTFLFWTLFRFLPYSFFFLTEKHIQLSLLRLPGFQSAANHGLLLAHHE